MHYSIGWYSPLWVIELSLLILLISKDWNIYRNFNGIGPFTPFRESGATKLNFCTLSDNHTLCILNYTMYFMGFSTDSGSTLFRFISVQEIFDIRFGIGNELQSGTVQNIFIIKLFVRQFYARDDAPYILRNSTFEW